MTTNRMLGLATDTWDSENGGMANVMIDKVTALFSGRMTGWQVKVSAGGTVKLALYADSAGQPGALLTAQNDPASVSIGWNTIACPTPTDLVLNTVYWLGFLGSVAGGMFYYRGESGKTNRYKAATYSSYSYPNPAGSGYTAQANYDYSIRGYGILTVKPYYHFLTSYSGNPSPNFIVKPTSASAILGIGAPIIEVQSTPLAPYVKILINHPALKRVRVFHNGQLQEDYDGLSNLSEQRIEPCLELPIKVPATVEITILSGLIYTYEVQ